MGDGSCVTGHIPQTEYRTAVVGAPSMAVGTSFAEFRRKTKRRRIQMSPQAATAMQPVKGSAPVKQAATTTDVFDQIQQTYDSIARRAFDIFNNNGRWFGNELGDWLQAEAELLQPVRLEIAEADDSITVRAEVPGFNAKELEINIESPTLT